MYELSGVKITCVRLMAPHARMRLGSLAATTSGLDAGTKNSGGYVRVIEVPGAISRGTVKDNVTETSAFAAMRSEDEIAKLMTEVFKRVQKPLEAATKKGETQRTGACNVIPLCIIATRNDAREEGTLALTVTNISTADTALQLAATEPSENRALH